MINNRQMAYCTLCSRHMFITNLAPYAIEIDYRTRSRVTHKSVCVQCCQYIQERNELFHQLTTFLAQNPQKHMHMLRQHALQETVI